jgi:hypothetical protein
MKKIYDCFFRGRKGENESSKPTNGIWDLKSVWLCDISIDREFYMEHEKIYLWGSIRQKKSPRAQKRNFNEKTKTLNFFVEFLKNIIGS